MLIKRWDFKIEPSKYLFKQKILRESIKQHLIIV